MALEREEMLRGVGGSAIIEGLQPSVSTGSLCPFTLESPLSGPMAVASIREPRGAV